MILSDKHDDFLLVVIPDGSDWIGETRFATEGSTIAESHQEPLSCLRGVQNHVRSKSPNGSHGATTNGVSGL